MHLENTHSPLETTASGFTKIGIVAVGSGACGLLAPLHGSFPHLHRSVAIDNSPTALDRAKAHCNVWVGRSENKASHHGAVQLQAKAVESEIRDALRGLHLIWLLSSLGGSAGTAIAPVVADVAKELEITVIAASTTPFSFEGRRRQQTAQTGLNAITHRVLASLELSNDALAADVGDESLTATLARAGDKFSQMYCATSTVISQAGLIGVDFEDLQAVLAKGSGTVAFGHGCSDSLAGAYQAAVNDVLLGAHKLREAKGVFVTLQGPEEHIQHDAISAVTREIHSAAPNALHIFGATVDKETRVTLMAAF